MVVYCVSNHAKHFNSLWRQYLERFAGGAYSSHCDSNADTLKFRCAQCSELAERYSSGAPTDCICQLLLPSHAQLLV